MKIRSENTYSDGHESKVEYDIPEFDGDDADEDAVADYFFEWTGDGHGEGENSRLGCYTEIYILESANPHLVGQVLDYGG